MIQVILDTNILEQSPHRSNAEFHALQKLCSNRKIQLHLPDVVQKEFLSHREETLEEGIQLIAKGIRRLKREKVTKQSQFSELLDSWENRLNELKTEFIATTQEEFSQWGDSLNIQFHKIGPHHGEAVVRAYFKGELPFQGVRNRVILTNKESRSRVEFADAFIWQTVLDILQQYKRVHFISNNTKDFQKLCKETPGVILHPSLKEFLVSHEVQGLFLEQFTEQNFETILAILKQKEADLLPKLVHEVAEVFDRFHYDFEGLIDPTAYMSGWSYSGEGDWKVEIQYDQASHYGYGIISLPLTVEIEEFDISYTRTLHNIPWPPPPNIDVLRSATIKLGEPVSVFTEDYFPIKLYTSAEVALSANATDALKTEDIPKLIEQAHISVNQIDDVEADETKRKQYDTIL